MSGRVVSCGRFADIDIYFGANFRIVIDPIALQFTDMDERIADSNGVLNLNSKAVPDNFANIPYLSSGFTVKRCSIKS